MEGIILLSGIKILIDLFENNWTGVATGILLPPPVSELYTIGDSIYYLFDLNGNKIGTKDVSGINQYSFSDISLKNESQTRIGLSAAKKNIALSSRNNSIGLT